MSFNELSISEQQKLEQNEIIIEKGLGTFYEVGSALLDIRDNKLYRQTHKTFEEYCQVRWDMSKPRAYQLMETVGVIDNLSTIVDVLPQTESQIRPLTQLEPEAQQIVWEVVQKTSPTGKVTAEHVKSVANVFKEIIETKENNEIDIPNLVKAAITEETFNRWQEQKQALKEKDEKRENDRIKRLEDIRVLKEASQLGGVYPIIYADPPWQYEHVKTPNRAIENHYETQDLDWICNLKINGRSISEISGENAMLFLWTTSPKLEEAFRVINSWGFTYRTSMVWDKEKMGMGDYFRIQHEFLLIAKKGNIRTPDTSVRQRSVYREMPTEHSVKPEKIYEYIELMYPEYPRLELFSRNVRDGWEGWGNDYTEK